MSTIVIELVGDEIKHLREMGRQQLLADYEAVIDCVDGCEAAIIGIEAGERFLFTSRLLPSV
jgi:hypothetical protein